MDDWIQKINYLIEHPETSVPKRESDCLPGSIARETAVSFTKRLSEFGILPTHIQITAVGAIGLVYQRGQKRLSVECDNDGDVTFFATKNNDLMVSGYDGDTIDKIVDKVVCVFK